MGVTGFLVDKDAPGLRIGKPLEKMGLKTSPMAEIFLEDCEIPAEALLGTVGGGAAVFASSMEWERGCLLASYIGSMERQLHTCIEYARTRRQFNRAIGKFQSVANKMPPEDQSRLQLEAALKRADEVIQLLSVAEPENATSVIGAGAGLRPGEVLVPFVFEGALGVEDPPLGAAKRLVGGDERGLGAEGVNGVRVVPAGILRPAAIAARAGGGAPAGVRARS